MKHILTALLLLTPLTANAGLWQDITLGRPLDVRAEEPRGYGVADGTGKRGYLFEDKLVLGTALPRVSDGRALLLAARMDQVVQVAGPWSFEYPVLVEIARQNRVSTEWLIDYLNANWIGESNPQVALTAAVAEIETEGARMEAARVAQQAVFTRAHERENDVVAPVVVAPSPAPAVAAPVVAAELTPSEIQDLYDDFLDNTGNADDFAEAHPKYEDLIDDLESGFYGS